MRSVRTYIGLGANLGDARRTLTDAIGALDGMPGANVVGVSRLYRTKPVGLMDQPDFLNAVAAVDVPATGDPSADAVGLLVALKDIERAFGREPRERWGPREVDLDLLLFGWHRISVQRPPEGTPRTAAVDPRAATRLLEVPHPAIRDRLFVLAPLADLAPDLVPPGWPDSIDSARRRQAAIEGPSAVAIVGSWSDRDATWVGPSGSPITVRRAEPRDAEAAARAHTAASEEAYRDTAPRDPDGLARRTAAWGQNLANPAIDAFVALDGDRIVGVLSISASVDDPHVGVVRVLYVMPEWWGSGAGQLLMDRAHAELASHFQAAELMVLTANPRARRFYERNGWELAEYLVEPHFGGHRTEVARYRRSPRPEDREHRGS